MRSSVMTMMATTTIMAAAVLGGCSSGGDDEQEAPGASRAAEVAADPAKAASCAEMGQALPGELAATHPSVKAVVDSAEQAEAAGKASLACTVTVTLTGADGKKLGTYSFLRTVTQDKVQDSQVGKKTVDTVLYAQRKDYFNSAQSDIAVAVTSLKKSGGKLPQKFGGLKVKLPPQLTAPHYVVTKGKRLQICLEDSETNARALLTVRRTGGSTMTVPTTGDCTDAAQEFATS